MIPVDAHEDLELAVVREGLVEIEVPASMAGVRRGPARGKHGRA